MKTVYLYCCILAALLMLHCNGNTLTSPEEVTNGTSVLSGGSGAGNGTSAHGGISDDGSACFDSLGIRRTGITYRVIGRDLFIFVPASGADYVRVWTPGVNDQFLGQGPVNQEFSVQLPGYGTFKITLAIERRTTDGVCQYDGHSFVVTAVPPPTRTPNPPEDPPEDPEDPPEDPEDPPCEEDCDEDPEPEPDPDPEPEPEPEGQCFYEVKVKRDEDTTKETKCIANGGTFSEHDGSDHCVFDLPGIADDDFNLAPGLSHEDCLRKQDVE